MTKRYTSVELAGVLQAGTDILLAWEWMGECDVIWKRHVTRCVSCKRGQQCSLGSHQQAVFGDVLQQVYVLELQYCAEVRKLYACSKAAGE